MYKKETGFTKAAMAGLAAKEDYTSVKLKTSNEMTHVEKYPPFNELMLIQIKGRRYCQVRLVEPCIESLNNGDCFLLVTNLNLFLLLGETANIIEKSKANELYDWIRLKKDLGLNKTQSHCAIIDCKSSLIFKSMPDDGENENCLTQTEQQFLSILQKNSSKQFEQDKFQVSDKDETYEQLITETNKVYRVALRDEYETNSDTTTSDDSNEETESNKVAKLCLEPLKDYCGNLLSYNVLDEDHVLVFDFAAEFYIWSGRNSPSAHKKAAVLLAKQYFNSGYDYSASSISPLNGRLREDVNDDSYFVGKVRPKWAVFGRQTQNAETVLFRGKFIDWPNQNNTPALKKIGYNGSLKKVEPIIKSQSPKSIPNTAQENIFNYESLSDRDVQSLVAPNDTQVNLILEQTNLGRGRHWFDQTENRRFDIVTENVHGWKIVNNELVDCGKLAELIENYSYVIKWHYKVNAVGFRTLKGNASSHKGVRGRDRYALFFWQGKNASRSEKGCSALLSLDNLAASIGSNSENSENQSILGNEKHSLPHVQVNQNEEIAAFCQLFNGSLIIMNNEISSDDKWRMFELRGELEEESHLIEVKLISESLRSRTSFLFINSQMKRTVIWHGAESNNLHKSLLRKCSEKLRARYDWNFNGNEVAEGIDDQILQSIFNQPISDGLSSGENEFTARLFLMTSLYGKFEVKEILNPIRSEYNCPFPFFQFNMYEQEQPSLFMIDNGNEIYLWQGWYESLSNENSMAQIRSQKDATDGTTKLRYNRNRKCALETAIKYWNVKNSDKEFRGFVVYAGLEPKEFTKIFPTWQVNENARNCNLNDGKIDEQKDCIMKILATMNRDRYPASVLRERPLPDGVNPLKLENYLSDEEFEELLQTTKGDFAQLPTWKQSNLKKKARLF